ncbi:MAG: hypothetical protein HY943_19310 [Gammaproteobacteria bacterium]|nr:hypothetical protein [Gammaproteobacteria bacterium]
MANPSLGEALALHAAGAYAEGGKDPKLLATAYYQLGPLAEPAECYRGCVDRNPDDAIALHRRAACAGVNAPTRASEAYAVAKFDEMTACADEPGYRLVAIGCYSHTRPYLAVQLAAAGFEVHGSEPFEVRRELGRLVEGVGVAAAKARCRADSAPGVHSRITELVPVRCRDMRSVFQ